MKLAIIHNHLNRGGVTQVIANHLRALDKALNEARDSTINTSRLSVALLYGGRSEGWQHDLADELSHLDLSLHEIDELDYDNVRPRSRDLTRLLRSTLQQAGFADDETVLHVHNHSLGKNVQLPGALQDLACEGCASLLQIHDFAEDFRPDNYRELGSAPGESQLEELPALLYPQAAQIHYAVLNGRDRAILGAAGVDEKRLHLIPNPVADFGELPSRESARTRLADCFGIPAGERYVLYPVRGIRRKNLGEALLWSTLADGNFRFGLTLPPFNPIERPSCAGWKELAARLGLPWTFEVGGPNGLSFGDNLSAADLIMSTSVAEGFGLVFLEAWLANKNLVGRDLPEITRDFREAGLKYADLQAKFQIPFDWLNELDFRQQLTDAYRQVLTAYGRPDPGDHALEHAVDQLVCDQQLDFANCTSAMQQQIIRRVANDSTAQTRLRELNPGIVDALAMRNADPERIAANAETVRTQYSLARCGSRLLNIYERVVSSDRNGSLQPPARGQRVLESFLELTRFHPLRIET